MGQHDTQDQSPPTRISYRGSQIHRVVKGFVAVGGDILANDSTGALTTKTSTILLPSSHSKVTDTTSSRSPTSSPSSSMTFDTLTKQGIIEACNKWESPLVGGCFADEWARPAPSSSPPIPSSFSTTSHQEQGEHSTPSTSPNPTPPTSEPTDRKAPESDITGSNIVSPSSSPTPHAPLSMHDERGLIACASNGPDTNTSQFLITLGPSPFLHMRNVVFGKVCPF